MRCTHCNRLWKRIELKQGMCPMCWSEGKKPRPQWPFSRHCRFMKTTWILRKDCNPTGLAIYKRHYTYRHYRDGRKRIQFVGPGENMVLLTPNADALFVWRKEVYRLDDQKGVNCSVFRNEGSTRSSDLIREAVALAQEKWPHHRFYTFVNARKLTVRKCHGREYCPYPPGRCFIEAGWRPCGITKDKKLVILELMPWTQ